MKRKRGAIIAVLAVLMVAAVWLNIDLQNKDNASEDEQTSKILGQAQMVDGNGMEAGAEGEATDAQAAMSAGGDYCAQARLNRQNSRDEALELLREVSENQNADQDTRAQAAVDMSRIADEIELESAMENLICAKGFEDCVVQIADEKVTVCVKCAALLQSGVTQIQDIVTDYCDVTADQIKIMEIQ